MTVQHDLTPLTAPTAQDPFAYYARLVSERPFYFDETIGAWIASSAAAVDAILADDALAVRPAAEPVPKAMAGTPLGEVFGRLTRMTEGPRHDRTKTAVSEWLARIEPGRVYETTLDLARSLAASIHERAESALNAYLYDVPACAMASVVGIDPSEQTRSWIADFARAIAPGSDGERIALGAAAVERLRALIGEADEDVRANLLGLLFQSFDATAALIGNALAGHGWDDAPIHNTRRFATADTTILERTIRAGDSVLVLLAAAQRDPKATHGFAFGVGRHACPGSSIAMAIARAGVDALARAGVDIERFCVVGYQPSLNARIPVFGKIEEPVI